MAPPRNTMTPAEIRALIATEVGRAINDAIPGIVVALRDQLAGMIDERIDARPPPAAIQIPSRVFNYRDFSACNPPEFKGSMNPIESMNWLRDVEGAFLTSGCPGNLRVRYVRNLLRDSAKNWWDNWVVSANLTEEMIGMITWEDFRDRFREWFVPRVETDRIAREFLALQQTTETIPEFNKKFLDMVIYCPEYATSEEMKMRRYKDMVRDDIGLLLIQVQATSLSALMEAVRK